MGGDEEPPLAVPIDVRASFPKRPIEGNVSAGVTVITGYLGSGKSTLVNHVLNSQHGKRIAVILNEFGEEIGVERAMINEGDGGTLVEEWVELANGCVCCTVKHSLVQAMEQLVQRKERIDHILLETTGLANPAPLASILWLDDQLEAEVKLDSIITVVDAKNLGFQLSEHHKSSSFPEVLQQIAFADTIILNKIDLVSPEDLKDLEKEICNINSLAKVIHSVRCQVDLSRILNCQAYDGAHASHLEALLDANNSLSTSDLHYPGVRTLCICDPKPMDIDKPMLGSSHSGIVINSGQFKFHSSLGGWSSFDSTYIITNKTCEVRLWIEEILWDKKSGMNVYRCKGVLSLGNSDRLHTLQAVRELYDIAAARKWDSEESRMNKIVFIGHDLKEEVLSDSFRDCALSSKD